MHRLSDVESAAHVADGAEICFLSQLRISSHSNGNSSSSPTASRVIQHFTILTSRLQFWHVMPAMLALSFDELQGEFQHERPSTNTGASGKQAMIVVVLC